MSESPKNYREEIQKTADKMDGTVRLLADTAEIKEKEKLREEGLRLIKEIKTLVEETESLTLDPPITGKRYAQLKESIATYERVFNGEDSVDIFLKIMDTPVPEEFMDSVSVHEAPIVSLIKEIEEAKISGDQDVTILEDKINTTIEAIDHLAGDKSFKDFLTKTFSANLYAKIQKNKAVSEECRDRIRLKSYKAPHKASSLSQEKKPLPSIPEPEEPEEDFPIEAESIDPLLVGWEDFGIKMDAKATKKEAEMLRGKNLTADSFMISVGTVFNPELAKLQEEMVSLKSKKMNPFQQLMFNVLNTEVLNPVYKFAENVIICPQAVADKIGKIISGKAMDLIALIDSPGDATKTVRNFFLLVDSLIEQINSVLDSVLDSVGFGSYKIKPGPKYKQLCELIAETDRTARRLGKIIQRDPVQVAKERETTEYPIRKLQRMMALMEILRQEELGRKRPDPNALSLMQFLMQTIGRVKDDNELNEVMKDLASLTLKIFDYIDLESLSGIGITQAELESIFKISIPISINKKEQEKTPFYQRVDNLVEGIELSIREDAATSDQEKLLIGLALDNVRDCLLQPGNEARVKKELGKLRGLIGKFARGKDGEIKDPLLKYIVENEDFLTGCLTLFYHEKKEKIPDGSRELLTNLKDTFINLKKKLLASSDSKSKGATKIINSILLILDTFQTDEELQANYSKLEGLIKIIIEDEQYCGLKIKEGTLGQIKERFLSLTPKKTFPQDDEFIQQVSDIITMDPESPVDEGKVVALGAKEAASRMPFAGEGPLAKSAKLSNMMGVFRSKFSDIMKKAMGAGSWEIARGMTQFITKNYSSYLCEKYNNDSYKLFFQEGINHENIIAKAKSASGPEQLLNMRNINSESEIFMEIAQSIIESKGKTLGVSRFEKAKIQKALILVGTTIANIAIQQALQQG